MSPTEEEDRDQAFVEELLLRGWATEAQLAEARRLLAAAAELGQHAVLDEILVRKGFVSRDRVATARRDAAAKGGQTLRIGKYEVLQRLGEGGAGIVYRAYQTTLGREVALKVLSNKRVIDAEYLERFLREAKVAVTLNHVNIVRGLDYGQADGYHFFAMELVEGESLFQVIRREGRLPEKKALDVVLQIVRALEHAGKFHIVHRDIKPENVLLTKSGTAKLCDLGLARPVIEGGAADSEGRPMGTALYVAPELIRREAKLDFRADIYSLGATLYHALTGSPPYGGQTVTEIVRGHLSAPVPNPRDRAMDVSVGVAAVVMKMLAKDPADRYLSLEALDEDLASVMAGRPPVNTITVGRRAAPLAGEGAPARGGERRPSRSAVPLVVGVSLAALGGAAWLYFGKKAPEPPPVVPGPPVVEAPPKEGGIDAAKMRNQRENDAAAALAAADAWGKEHGVDSPGAVAKQVEVATAFPDTSAGRVAKQRAADLEKARAARIDAALRERSAAFDEAFAGGRLGAALAAWAGMPAEQEASGGRAAADAAKAKVEGEARRRLDAAKALAAKALAEAPDSQGPAREALRSVAACGLPAVEAEASKELAALEDALRVRAERLRAAEEAWPRVCSDVLAAAALSPRDGAAVLESAAATLAPVGERLAQLRQALNDTGGFLDAVRAGFSKAAAAGESVRLRAAGRPGGVVAGRASALRADGFEIQRGPATELVPLREIHPEDLAALAWKTLGAGGPGDHAGAAAFLLGRGAIAAAAREIEILDVMGAKDEAARVRALVLTVRGAARGRADAALREAEVLRLQKRPAEAKAAYERAVALCDGYAPPLWKQGAFLLESAKDVAEALRPLEAAAALDPAEPEAWYWIGEGRRRAGETAKSLEALDRFLERAAPDDPRREAALRSRDELRATASQAEVRQAREDAARAYRKDDFVAAEGLWRRVATALPEDTEAMYFLGKSLLGLDRKPEGYAWLRRFLSAEKRTGSRTDDAKRIAKDLEQRFGDSPAAIRKHQEGSVLINQNQVLQGIEALTAALDLAPLRADTYVERARGYMHAWAGEGRREHLNQAVRDLEMAVLINERNGRGWSLLAEARFRLDDAAGALDASSRAVQLDPAWSKSWEFRARAFAKLGRFLEAEQAATDGLAKEPRAMLLLARAEARLALGKTAPAREDLDEAAVKYELSPEEKAYRLETLGRLLKAEKGSE